MILRRMDGEFTPFLNSESISDYEEDIPMTTGKARVYSTTSKLTEQEEELLMDH